MSRTLPTEESLGLSPTEEELNSVSSIGNETDDDIPLDTDDVVETKPEEAAPEAAPQPERASEEPKTVDLRALQEARNEVRDIKAENRLLSQRMNDMIAMMGNRDKPVEKPAVPKFSEDPVAAGQWTQEQLLALVERQEAERRQSEQAQREESEFRAVANRVIGDYETTKAADPTLEVAYNALRESQGKELLAMGYTIPEAQAELNRLEREHIKFVAARGLNIGDYLKALATARGWNPSATVSPTPARTDLKSVAAAQERHQSLSNAPGGEAPPALDAKALARMSDKEFNAWLSQKGNDAKFEEIMGRT